jgi:hypothetical protein
MRLNTERDDSAMRGIDAMGKVTFFGLRKEGAFQV